MGARNFFALGWRGLGSLRFIWGAFGWCRFGIDCRMGGHYCLVPFTWVSLDYCCLCGMGADSFLGGVVLGGDSGVVGLDLTVALSMVLAV